VGGTMTWPLFSVTQVAAVAFGVFYHMAYRGPDRGSAEYVTSAFLLLDCRDPDRDSRGHRE